MILSSCGSVRRVLRQSSIVDLVSSVSCVVEASEGPWLVYPMATQYFGHLLSVVVVTCPSSVVVVVVVRHRQSLCKVEAWGSRRCRRRHRGFVLQQFGCASGQQRSELVPLLPAQPPTARGRDIHIYRGRRVRRRTPHTHRSSRVVAVLLRSEVPRVSRVHYGEVASTSRAFQS